MGAQAPNHPVGILTTGHVPFGLKNSLLQVPIWLSSHPRQSWVTKNETGTWKRLFLRPNGTCPVVRMPNGCFGACAPKGVYKKNFSFQSSLPEVRIQTNGFFNRHPWVHKHQTIQWASLQQVMYHSASKTAFFKSPFDSAPIQDRVEWPRLRQGLERGCFWGQMALVLL